jgi:hypothetical protein
MTRYAFAALFLATSCGNYDDLDFDFPPSPNNDVWGEARMFHRPRLSLPGQIELPEETNASVFYTSPTVEVSAAQVRGPMTVQLEADDTPQNVFVASSLEDPQLAYRAGADYEFSVSDANGARASTSVVAPFALDPASLTYEPETQLSGDGLFRSHTAFTDLRITWPKDQSAPTSVQVLRAIPGERPAAAYTYPQYTFGHSRYEARVDVSSILIPADTFIPSVYAVVIYASEGRTETAEEPWSLIVGTGTVIYLKID